MSVDFLNNEILTDVTKPAAVDVLLTNLITGRLLPSACLWITTRHGNRGARVHRCPKDRVRQEVRRRVVLPIQSSSDTGRVAVCLDWPAGTLSFFRVSSDALVHLHTFSCTFTEPLYPAFGIQLDCDSSVSLSQM